MVSGAPPNRPGDVAAPFRDDLDWRDSAMRPLTLFACAAGLAVATSAAIAQPPGGGPEGFRGGMGRMNPLVTALDSNSDGEISDEELQQATSSLKKLDKN